MRLMLEAHAYSTACTCKTHVTQILAAMVHKQGGTNTATPVPPHSHLEQTLLMIVLYLHSKLKSTGL